MAEEALGAPGQLRGALARLLSVARAGEWWEFKLVPLIALFYATTIFAGSPLAPLWPALLLLLAALLPGAIWVSVLNDLTDRREDKAAGKANRMEGRSASFATVALGLPMAAALVVCWAWRDAPALLLAYGLAWLSFGLYSLPPFRLKARGGWGILADAGGSNLFPGQVAMLLAFQASGADVELRWLAAGGVWSLAWGLRGILWHQLSDVAADAAAGVATFVRRRGAQRVAALGRLVVAPAELAGLCGLLWMLRDPLPPLAAFAYLLLLRRRLRVFRMNPVIVAPKPRQIIVMLEYYTVFLPLALLASATLRHPADGLLLLAHLLLFPAGASLAVRDAWRLRAA